MSADLQEAQARVDEWLREGRMAFDEGRVDEAMAIADSALESHPHNIDALHLKSLCYERLGKVAEALQYAERVVELNEDSELDKIRRNNLRSTLGAGFQLTDKQDRRYALAIATSAFAIVFAGSAYVWTQFTSKPSQLTAKNEPPPIERPTTFNTQPPNTNANAGNGVIPFINNAPSSSLNTPGPGATIPPTSASQESSGDAGDTIPLQRTTEGLPAPAESGSDLQLKPIDPPIEVSPDSPTNTGKAQKGANDPAPVVDISSNAGSPKTSSASTPVSTAPDVAPKAEDDPGQILITIHRGPSIHPIGNSQPVGGPSVVGPGSGGTPISANGLEALTRTAKQQFMLGNYASAASSYEKALHGGGDPIQLNQRLGQAYEKLGRNTEALNAYQRAVKACKDALAQGRGDKTKVQATLDSCVQAAKVLGG